MVLTEQGGPGAMHAPVEAQKAAFLEDPPFQDGLAEAGDPASLEIQAVAFPAVHQGHQVVLHQMAALETVALATVCQGVVAEVLQNVS